MDKHLSASQNVFKMGKSVVIKYCYFFMLLAMKWWQRTKFIGQSIYSTKKQVLLIINVNYIVIVLRHFIALKNCFKDNVGPVLASELFVFISNKFGCMYINNTIQTFGYQQWQNLKSFNSLESNRLEAL